MNRPAEFLALALGSAGIAVLTTLYATWFGLTNGTIVALSFLLVVLIVATASVRWVAIATSFVAFACFNFFFLPPVKTFAISDPENWVALFTLLAVGIVASHLSSQVRTRAEEAARLLDQQKEAEVTLRSAELKAALLASLSHDLKTPLTALAVAADNLNAGWLNDEERREQADIVRTEVHRLARLFRDILEMARIETNAVAVEPEWVTPEELLEAASGQVQEALARHRLAVQPGADRVLVWLDPRLTAAALAHVLENAAQYSPPGSTVTVSLSPGPEELQIVVRDRGPGLGADDLDHLFDPFYRGSERRLRRHGSGMGLAITRGLLAAEGGRVSAVNHPDGGAVFTLAIPAPHRPANTASEGLL